MAICEILVMEDFEQGQSVAGRIYLKDGKLTADAEEGNERLLRNILKNLEEEGGDPEKLLKELPQRYSGFAMRARLVGEEESGNDAAEADAPYTLQVKNDRGETSELTKKHLENARQTKRSLQAHNFEVIIKGKKAKPISVVVDEIRWPSWIGVDLDNTLEIPVEGDFNPLIIGPPNPAMVERVKKALQSGQTVKVFTARLAVEEPLRSQIRKVISKWTLQHVGQKLESTNEKDPGLIEIWDDRAKPIV